MNVYLYHGSNADIIVPCCDKGLPGRDFGQCFYTTYSRATAKNWAAKNYPNHYIVNKYSIDLEKLTDGRLRIKRFTANEEWAEFVWHNRFDKNFKRSDYDIIIGPISDRGLKEQFLKIRTEGKTFKDIAPLIHYDTFRSLQVAFCTPFAVSVLQKC